MAKEKPYDKEHVYKNYARRIGSTYKDAEKLLDVFFDMTRDYLIEYGCFHYKEEIQIDTKVAPEHTRKLPDQSEITVPEKTKFKVKLMSNYQKLINK